MGAYLRVGAYLRGRLLNNFPNRMGAYQSGAIIRGVVLIRRFTLFVLT